MLVLVLLLDKALITLYLTNTAPYFHRSAHFERFENYELIISNEQFALCKGCLSIVII